MANNRISGITVEIGGNTAPLSKSLKNVNSDLNQTQKGLNDVNRLLKLDPSNVDLLAQKQKYLAQQIEGTKNKLDSLKSAEQQVQAQFAQGKISQEQYDALQREIISTELSLSKFEAEAGKTADALNDMGDETEEVADGIGEVGDESGQAGTKLTAAAVGAKAASAAMSGLKTVVSGMGSAISSAVSKTAEMMASLAKTIAATMAIAAAAVVKFSVDFAKTAATVRAENSQFEQTFGDLQDSATKAIGRVADSSGILESRLKTSASSIYAFAKASGGDATESMDLMERGMQVAADSAAYYDKSLEDTSETLKSFLKGNYANDAALGVSATEFTRNAAATRLYGKEFNELTEIQKQFTLLNMVEEANALSGALGQAARESDGLENVVGNLKETWRQLQATLGEPILDAAVPILQNLATLIPNITSSLMPFANGIAKIMGLVAGGDINGLTDFLSGKKILNGIYNFTSSIGEMVNSLLSYAPQFIAVAQSYMQYFSVGLYESIAAISPETLGAAIMSVFSLATDYMVDFVLIGLDIIGKLAEGIAAAAPELSQTAMDTIFTFLTGLMASAEQIIPAAGAIIEALLQGIVDNGVMLMEAATRLVLFICEGIGEQLPTLIPMALAAVLTLVEGLLSAESLGNIVDSAISLITGLADGLINALPVMMEKAPTIIAELVRGLIENLPKIAAASLDIIIRLASALIENSPKIWQAGIDLIKELARGLIESGPNMIGSADSIAKDLVEKFKNIDLTEIGKNIIQGLINGIKSMASAVGDAIGNVANNAVSSVKNMLGIKSPSTVMKNEVGRWIPAGMAEGIDDNMNVVTNASRSMADDVILNATPSANITNNNGATRTDNSQITSLNIGSIEIVTQATDARGISDDLLTTFQNAMDRKGAVFA